MRLLVAALTAVVLLGSAVGTAVVLITDAEARARDLARDLGSAWTWSNDPWVSDPAVADRVLTDAATVARVNVFRSSSTTGSVSARPAVSVYVLLGASRTRLTDTVPLASGAWFSAEATRTGAPVTVSTVAGTDGRVVVGRPRVIGERFDLSFRPMRSAFANLPVSGRYVVEGRDAAHLRTFRLAIRRSLTAAGVPTAVAAVAFRPDGLDGNRPQLTHRMEAPWVFLAIGASTLAVACAACTVRRARSSAVLALFGLGSSARWYRVHGRVLSWVAGSSTVLSGVVTLFVPGMSLVPWARVSGLVVALACFVVVTSRLCSAVVDRRTPRTDL